MSHLYLIGMPGCGKTTLGKRLSSTLNLPFCDLDVRVEQREGATIPSLFQHGESYFRDAETRALKEAATLSPAVVSTGGGIIIREENAHIMKESGKIIFIDSAPEQIIARSDLSNRPLIGADAQRIYSLYEARISLYRRCADITVENNGRADDAFACLLAAAKRLMDIE